MPTAGIGTPKVVNYSNLNIRGIPVQLFVTVDSAAGDGGTAGAANTDAAVGKLQPGLLLAPYTSGSKNGKYGPYDNTATDGRQNVEDIVVLLDEITDVSTGDQDAGVMVGGGAVISRSQFRYQLAAAKTALADLFHDMSIDSTP